MSNFLEQAALSFVGFVVVRMAESYFAISRSRQSDQTERIKERVSPAIATLLNMSGVRILRVLHQRNVIIAEARFIFPRTIIFYDYDETTASGSFEDFVIAHELGHVRGNHPILRLIVECAFAALFTSLAIELTLSVRPLIAAAMIAVPIIIAGVMCMFPLHSVLAFFQEREADLFSAKLTGFSNALTQMYSLVNMFPTRRSLQNDLHARMRALQTRQAKASAD